ncbi:MAG: Calx-beta domain-containing protein, partial [Desulfococcaceae bacterium]|nr:Calx-beta domain-containing protein [Desulfococcaceae bacterium]
MFRLMRLEDRIVLDGAAFTDALDEMQKQKLHEQQMFDADASDDAADAHDDVHYRSGIDTADPLFIVDDALVQDSSGTHVLVVSSKLEGADDLAAAVNDNVIVVKYDPAETSLKDLADTIRDALGGDQADSIAFASHNAGEGALGIGSEPISADSLAADAAQQEFWKTVGGSLAEDGRIDLLACSVVGTDAGEYLVSQIENISGANVAASSDATGNDAYGGDWVLESDDINIEATYFDSELLAHVEGVFGDAPPIANPDALIPDIPVNWTGTGWPTINTKLPTWAGGTLFTDADGDPLTYDAYVITSEGDLILDTSPGTQFSGLAFMDGSQTLVGNTTYFAVAPEIGDDYEIRIVATDESSSQTDEQTFFLSFRDPNSTLPKATLSVSGSPMAEAGGVATVTVTLDADAPAGGARIVLGFGGDAESGDYTPSGGVISIAQGATSGFITLTANDDADSMDETVLVSIDSVSGAQEDGVQQVAATITDDEGSMPTVTLGISSTQIAEQGTPQNLTAYLSSAAPVGGITVNLDFTGTFDSGDYTAANSIFISAGNTAGSITVTANDDADLVNETLGINVVSSSDYAMGSPATVNATLVDNDYPSVTLSLSSTTFNEEGGTTNVIATLSEAAPAGADIYVSFAGTADAGQYTVTPAGTVITIGPGGSTGQLTLTGKSDTITEGDQTVVVDIVTATGAQEAGDQSVTATILDDDLVTVSLSASEATISEEGGATVVTATLNKQTSGGNVIVYLGYTGDAAAGTDYTGNAASISINYPNTTGSITLTGKHDTLIEGDESFVVDISSVLGASEGTPGSVPIAITDNDYSTVTLGISSPTFNEAGGSTQVTAYLDQPAGPGGVTVDLSYGGTADASDFSASPGSIFITAGSSSGSLTLTAENDGTVEGDESLTASISTITGQATVGTTSQVSATIVDDDAVYVSLDIDSATVSETGEGTALVTATLSKATDHDVTVGLTFSGTAVSGSDYSAAGNSIFISQGSTAGSIKITVADDSIVEGDETLTVNASSIVGASQGTPLADSLTIIDNDLTSVTLGVSGSPFSENGGSADLVATLTAPSANNVIVDLAFAGSATFGTDYTAATSIFITAGSTTGSIALTGSDDAVAEYNETIVIDIVSVSGGAEETTAQQVTASITDDDVPVATLGISKTDIPEDGGVPGGTADVTVYLDRPAMAGGVVVNLTVSGTAAQGDDYALSSTSFFIDSGATSKTRTIYVDNDTAFEGDETIVLSLGTVSGASKGTPDFINATISDDETAPGVALAFDKVTFAEGASAVVTATLDYVSDVPVTVDLSFSGTVETEDYNASASTIVISAGSLTGTVTIGAVDDTLYEGDEGITVDIANVVNATDGAAVAVSSTIIDSEQAPSLTLSLSPASFSENGGSVVVTATLDYASFEPVTVEFGFSGTAESNEYGASATSITITAGQTVGTITLSGIDDSMTEPEETIVVDVASLSGATEGSVTTVTASLLDDDNTPVVTLGLSSPTFLENGGTSLVVASLDHSTSETVTVDLGFTGTAGSSEYSYTANSIVITAGNTTGSIELSSIDDSDNENDETVVVNITAVSGASEAVAQTVSATIVDDDAAPGVTLAISKASFSEGGESAVVTATLAAATIDPVTVTLGLGGTADGSDYSYDASVITISAGDTSGSITITGEDDSAYEGDETLLVDIVAVEGATESGTQQVSATITDNDPAPTITLGIDDGALLENGGLEFITVYLNGDTELPVTVDLNFSGTAQLGIDYTASETSIVIDPTDSFYNIILSGSDDDVYEGNENIVLSVGAVEGATAGTPSSVTVTVTEDDGKPAVTLGVTSPFMEGSTTPAELTAYLSEASDVDSTINLVFSGTAETTDYNYSSAQIVITAGNTTGSIDLTSVDDSVFEGDETVAVSLGTLSDGLT